MATSNLGYQSFYQTTLSSNISDTDLTIPLTTLPTPSEGFLVIESGIPAKREIIYYTSKTASAVVCPADGRGYDGTTAVSHLSGADVIMAPVAAMFETMRDLFETTPQGWTPVTQTVSSVSANGNRSYDVTFSSTVAATMSPGMRLRTTRTVAAPTQCTSLNGTTQYYSKSSPAGMTFTDDFVVSAWIKLTAYPGSSGTILSRYNGTSGFVFDINSSGQVRLLGYNAGAANVSYVQSYQSIPLNKWVHIAAQLDMSAFTATTTTSYVMIDGLDVPAVVSRGGTNPTALVQAGNLEIGSNNGGANPFPGKLAQVAIYSAKVTQANIKATISQGLAGSETSLISAYSFNNSITDLNTTNANNLTANGSAVATNADSPFGYQSDGTISSTLDYGIVTKVATTVATVQVPEGCTIPTTGGVTSVSYSTQKAPFGMPIERGRWTIQTLFLNNAEKTSAANGTWYNPNFNISLPVGSWYQGYQGSGACINSAGAPDLYFTLSTTTNSETDYEYTVRPIYTTVSTNATVVGFGSKYKNVTVSATTTYYWNIKCSTAGSPTLQILGGAGGNGSAILAAECAYL
jgi:hypothetical protein